MAAELLATSGGAMGRICEGCFHARGADVHIGTFPGGYLCARCVLRTVDAIAAQVPLVRGICLFCTQQTLGARVGEAAEHVLCPQCAPLLGEALADVAAQHPAI